MLELSGLSETRNMKSVFNALSNFEVNIKQVENTKSIYEISNTRTLGITEEDIVRGVKVITQKIIDQEREIRKFLAKDGVSLEDKVYRSYGILLNCRRLSYEESKEYISMLKLGTDLGLIPELTDLQIKKLDFYSKPANLQKYLGSQYDSIDLDIKRAETIKKIMKGE